MPNETAMTNDESRLRRAGMRSWRLRCAFVIAVSSFIRHSNFVIRHSSVAKVRPIDLF